ncbi:MAG: response regulator [Pseudomonadota bacterium]
MENTGGGTVGRIFVKVFGFGDVERHALNTVFRLSESRPVAYALWTEDSREKAQAALIDGDSWEAAIALANPGNDRLKIVWVGERPASGAALSFSRPLPWAAVLEGMDRLFVPVQATTPSEATGKSPGHDVSAVALDFDLSATATLDIDFDLDLGEVLPDAAGPAEAGDADTTTEPGALEAGEAEPQGDRVLVIESDRAARLYLRAKLANAGLLLVDEAVTGAEALAFMATNSYVLVLVDLGVADVSGWKLLGDAKRNTAGQGHALVMREGLSFVDRVRASLSGAKAALAKPLHPRDLKRMLADIGRPLRR